MSRRPHKKSRNGCQECKRRHVRCDEQRPICAHCSRAEIRCSFLGRDEPYIVREHSTGHPEVPLSANIEDAASTPASTQPPPYITTNENSFDTYSVNMTHIELFNNLFSDEFLSVEKLNQPDVIPSAIYRKHALTTPYLMQQILAVSALNLSIRNAGPPGFYHEYSTGLQNRAIKLFNESNPVLEVTPSNCVHMFMFSSLLGGHLLCDTLYYRRDSLEDFVDGFTNFLTIYRGVLAIVEQCWPLLHETELGPYLQLSRSIMQPTGHSGSECDALRKMVLAADVSPFARKAYREAVLYLQQAFDVERPSEGNRSGRPVIFVWPILVSAEYVDLLRQRQPEALVILAYYAVVLLHGRDLWPIGDAGRFLIDTICASLGADWNEWLKFPKETLRDDLVA